MPTVSMAQPRQRDAGHWATLYSVGSLKGDFSGTENCSAGRLARQRRVTQLLDSLLASFQDSWNRNTVEIALHGLPGEGVDVGGGAGSDVSRVDHTSTL
jgi:hypothetical protein